MLRTEICGVKLKCCIYNASGPRTGTIESLEKIGKSEAGAILTKSATLFKREGNPLPRFINKIKLNTYSDGAVNSEGLPNAGIDYYIGEEAKKILTGHSKPYIISLSGLSLADNVDMLNKIYQDSDGIAAIELNLACPNIPGKPVVSNDFEQMEEVLKTITELPNFKSLPFGIKLGPYFDMPFFERAADIIAKYPIRYVVSCNTIGNALFINAENECEAMAANRGMGGLGGGFIKHTALANVRTLRELLDERGRANIDLVGVGGVATGRDAFELILCGAKAVQVGSCHWTEGPACFARIAQELTDIMRRKGYSSIEEFRGKLKPYIKKNTCTECKVNTPSAPTPGSTEKKESDVVEPPTATATSTAPATSTATATTADTTANQEVNAGVVALQVFYVLLGAAIAMLVVRVRSSLGI